MSAMRQAAALPQTIVCETNREQPAVEQELLSRGWCP